MSQVNVRQLFEDKQKRLQLSRVAGADGTDRIIDSDIVDTSNKGLIGHFNLIHRDTRADQTTGQRGRRAQTAYRQPYVRNLGSAGHRSCPAYHCKVPGINAHTPGESP